jgi:hypothetical protein
MFAPPIPLATSSLTECESVEEEKRDERANYSYAYTSQPGPLPIINTVANIRRSANAPIHVPINLLPLFLLSFNRSSS